MNSFLFNVISFIENSGFYFAPILAMMGLLNLSELKRTPARKAYLLITGIMLAVYLIFGGSARYTLIPLLLFGALSAAGAVAPVRYLRRWTNRCRFIKARYLLILMTLITVFCSALKLFQRHRSTAIRLITAEMRSWQGKFVLCSTDWSQGVKVGGLLMHKPGFEFKNFANWPETIDFLSSCQTGNGQTEVYLLTRIPGRYTADDFRQWFRGKYSVYPFDAVKVVQDRSRSVLLLKYNARTSDGTQDFSGQKVLQQLPQTLKIEPFHHWGVIDIGQYLSADPRIFVAEDGTRRGSKLYLRKQQGQLPGRFRLEIRNQLGWLEDFRQFDLSGQATPPAQAKKIIGNGQTNTERKSSEAPLLLQPTEVFVPQKDTRLNWSGAIPLWSPGSQRFEITCSNGSSPAEQSCLVHDRFLQTKTNISYRVITADTAKLAGKPLKICLIQESHSSQLQLVEYLQKMLSPDSSLQEIQLTETAENALQHPHLSKYPARDCDVLLVNIFVDALARPWTIPLMIDPYLDEYITDTVREFRKNSPRARIALLLPPSPAAGESMYPYCNSPLLARLAHYNICSALQRWHRRVNMENVWLVPLYLSCDPSDGYQRYSQSAPVWLGYEFTPASKKLMAEITGTFLVYSEKLIKEPQR